jgi:hypothetical protein
MQNPWLNLPSTPPFIAPCDLEILNSRRDLFRGLRAEAGFATAALDG